MTRDETIQAMEKAIFGAPFSTARSRAKAEAAYKIARNAVLEEAARVADSQGLVYGTIYFNDRKIAKEVADQIVAAIRAMKGE